MSSKYFEIPVKKMLTKLPKMMAKKYSCTDAFAKPHRRKATMLLPIALANMTQGYGYRSLRCPSKS